MREFPHHELLLDGLKCCLIEHNQIAMSSHKTPSFHDLIDTYRPKRGVHTRLAFALSFQEQLLLVMLKHQDSIPFSSSSLTAASWLRNEDSEASKENQTRL
jgi:hypothetical protein